MFGWAPNEREECGRERFSFMRPHCFYFDANGIRAQIGERILARIEEEEENREGEEEQQGGGGDEEERRRTAEVEENRRRSVSDASSCCLVCFCMNVILNPELITMILLPAHKKSQTAVNIRRPYCVCVRRFVVVVMFCIYTSITSASMWFSCLGIIIISQHYSNDDCYYTFHCMLGLLCYALPEYYLLEYH